jgi:hypothetical protein
MIELMIFRCTIQREWGGYPRRSATGWTKTGALHSDPQDLAGFFTQNPAIVTKQRGDQF